MAMSRPASAPSRLLASLPVAERQRILACCETVELTFGDILAESGKKIRHVYFPVSSFVSLVATLDKDEQLEVGIVGDEGMLGTSLILGIDTSPLHVVVQGAGPALRMAASVFVRELGRSPALRLLMNRYVFVLMNQLAQTAICTRYHFVDARLARWLLLTRDRAHSGEFHLTQQFMSYMLGVRRVGVTKAASALEKRGLIEYKRGEIRILDVRALERASCECYTQGKAMYDQVLGSRRRPPRGQ
jgi:CRP-like cAMP-binding protein